ncbi:hypothetical protein [Nocardia vaccinii]|uniref:hypothetical protein n=1 Tax=Nocardia vaccinii TaxID=1822 RepID=UPI000837786F|nr:hypothetical protein [Nocardia vaccinii]
MTAPDPLAEATRLLGLPAQWDNPIEITSAATALALLGIAPLLRELVEQQKLANVIAAYQSPARDDFLTVDEQEDAAVYVNGRVNDIVYRLSGSETA